jgi:hypothetical protein
MTTGEQSSTSPILYSTRSNKPSVGTRSFRHTIRVPADFCRAVVCSAGLSHIHNLDYFAVSVDVGQACLYCICIVSPMLHHQLPLFVLGLVGRSLTVPIAVQGLHGYQQGIILSDRQNQQCCSS